MNKSTKIVIGIVVATLIIGAGWFLLRQKTPKETGVIKIGIITDLTGSAAYWGNSTRIGAELAKKELEKAGYKTELVFEDYQLDAAKALTSAQKLINVDNVNSIYAEFNPAAISVGSFLKDKNKLLVYDAAVTSPLRESDNFYKTYLDYQKGCKAIASKFKEQGVSKLGMLKVNLEFGEICFAGAKEIYGNNLFSESYNLGDTDFATQVLKLKNDGIGAMINTGFEGDTLNALKALRNLIFKIPYGTVDDTITDNVKKQYASELKATWSFGFKDVSSDFEKKVNIESSGRVLSYYGAAIAYTHIKQMVKSLAKCGDDLLCAKKEMNDQSGDSTVGFIGFKDRIANFDMAIKQY